MHEEARVSEMENEIEPDNEEPHDEPHDEHEQQPKAIPLPVYPIFLTKKSDEKEQHDGKRLLVRLGEHPHRRLGHDGKWSHTTTEQMDAKHKHKNELKKRRRVIEEGQHENDTHDENEQQDENEHQHEEPHENELKKRRRAFEEGQQLTRFARGKLLRRSPTA
jgi:hypothetical protein